MAKRMQTRVWEWCERCFEGLIDWSSRKERCFRFLEEALELCQSLELTKEEALRVVDYVYGRPIGEPEQEVGGVMITLYALGAREGIDIEEQCRIEYGRIMWPPTMDKIRNKQIAKKAAHL